MRQDLTTGEHVAIRTSDIERRKRPHARAHCAHVLVAADAAVMAARTIRIDDDRIAAVEPAGSGEPVLAMPVLVNAHDHARACARARSAPATSRSRPGCTISRLLPSVDPYLASAVSLARSALGGAGW